MVSDFLKTRFGGILTGHGTRTVPSPLRLNLSFLLLCDGGKADKLGRSLQMEGAVCITDHATLRGSEKEKKDEGSRIKKSAGLGVVQSNKVPFEN